MSAAVKVYRGDTWQRAWELKDAAGAIIDLTAASARLHVRDESGSLLIEASGSNGRMVIQMAQGRVEMTVPYEAMEIAAGTYSFDFEVTHAGGVRRTYEAGALIVLEDQSRG